MSKRAFVAFRASLASKVSWTRKPRRKFHRYTQLWVIDNYDVKLAILLQNHWLIIPPNTIVHHLGLTFPAHADEHSA